MSDEPIDEPADAVPLGLQRLPAGERDQARRSAREIFERRDATRPSAPQLRARDDPAEISIALGDGDEDGQGPGRRPRRWPAGH